VEIVARKSSLRRLARSSFAESCALVSAREASWAIQRQDVCGRGKLRIPLIRDYLVADKVLSLPYPYTERRGRAERMEESLRSQTLWHVRRHFDYLALLQLRHNASQDLGAQFQGAEHLPVFRVKRSPPPFGTRFPPAAKRRPHCGRTLELYGSLAETV